MVNNEKIAERRKSKRYKAIEGSFAATGPASFKQGQVIDISMGGLSFEYIDTSSSEIDNQGVSKGNILLSGKKCHVEDLLIKTITDNELTDIPSFSAMKLRKQRVQFKDLSATQMSDLDYYIRLQKFTYPQVGR